MVVTRLYILQHVLTILEIGIGLQNILIDHGINLVINLTKFTDEAYQYILDKEH